RPDDLAGVAVQSKGVAVQADEDELVHTPKGAKPANLRWTTQRVIASPDQQLVHLDDRLFRPVATALLLAIDPQRDPVLPRAGRHAQAHDCPVGKALFREIVHPLEPGALDVDDFELLRVADRLVDVETGLEVVLTRGARREKGREPLRARIR